MVDEQNLITSITPRPSINYPGEWTFSYFKDHVEFIDEAETGRTYPNRGMVRVAILKLSEGV